MPEFAPILVGVSVLFLLLALYSGKIRAEVAFFSVVMFLTVFGVLTPKEAISGFANEQLAVIILLLILSDTIRKTNVMDALFDRLFKNTKTQRSFVARMMLFVAPASAFFNNTPLVAMMMPYVHSWSKRNGISPSKLLIPLSYVTIVGGCVTLVGTSTNLIVNGMAVDAGFPSLGIFDFTIVGLPLAITAGIYLYFFSDRLLKDHKDALDEFKEDWREYFVETEVSIQSTLIGKTILQAGLRNLKGNFLVEIVRNDRIITPVSPLHILRSNDRLIFTGGLETIKDMIKSEMGLSLPKTCETENLSDVVEIVLSYNSSLIGKAVKDSDFRGKYDAAIVAVHRNGEKISGKLGEVELEAGDALLLFAGRDFYKRATENAFYIISKRQNVLVQGRKALMVILGVLASVAVSALTPIPLFTCLLIVLAGTLLVGALTVTEVRKGLDLNLLVIMAFGLAMGKALTNSGAADFIADQVLHYGKSLGPVAMIAGIFTVTNLLGAYMTNKAAVALIFPISISLAQSMNLPIEPFILVVAFGGAASFITPIGYQTNLMVYGSGGYNFNDFMKIGLPLTLIYITLGTVLLSWQYGLF
ncbi:MAG: SLC13 family permease [Flavobacteriales bacterium]|nr:SLC13 family permease [Flavobacteriales bacterium]